MEVELSLYHQSHEKINVMAHSYGYLSSQLKISVMKAIDFEKSALEHGLAIGSKKDFFWVESLDDRIWCLLLSKSAIDFANSLNLEKEAVEGGAYLIYFSG